MLQMSAVHSPVAPLAATEGVRRRTSSNPSENNNKMFLIMKTSDQTQIKATNTYYYLLNKMTPQPGIRTF